MAMHSIVPWEEYSNYPIFDHITNITQFHSLIQFPQFIAPDDKSLRPRLADRVYQELYAVVGEAKLGRLEQVRRHSEDGSIGAKYSDPDHEFAVLIRSDLSLMLVRPGSSFERFYEWYSVVMPHFGSFAKSVQSEYQSILNSREGLEIKIIPTRSRYTFKFILHDFFTDTSRSRRVKNTSLIGKALTRVPNEVGSLVPLEDAILPELGRVDLNLSRWARTPAGPVREIYTLQAPSNRDYGALWVDFDYIAESSDSEELPRDEIDHEAFLARVDLPINDFLQSRCLRHFLTDLSDGIRFSTSSAGLP